MIESLITDDDREFLAGCFDDLTTELVVISPSQWAEQKRYLPQAATPMPGPFRFEVTPYLREIVDCMSPDSPVRELAVMKGVQVCMTTGVIENAIGYGIDHLKAAPMMLLTADAELAKLRLENNVIPMIQLSGLDHLIRSSDVDNKRKTGKTNAKIEWMGGGFLIPFGAQNANKLRSIPIQWMLRDEVDAYPLVVGKDGDPMKLSEDRTAAFEGSRKIADLSTPTIEGRSAIEKRYERGDKRKYFVRCLKCSFPQELRWEHHNRETGEKTGFVWELDEEDKLVPGSVRYLCKNCGHPHINEDKTRLLSPDYGAEWKATAVPVSPYVRSYHLSALYSPPGMQTWEACAQKWIEAWDVRNSVPRDHEALQVFYNNVLGEPYRVRGNRRTFEQVSAHRRPWYKSGEIPNREAVEYSGSPILLLTCAVDVHADNLAVSVKGWCRDQRPYVILYERLRGDTSTVDDPGTWGALRTLIENREWVADDRKRYRISNTVIDSGYHAEVVYKFCEQYEAGVYPIKGQDAPPKAARLREFSPFTTTLGTVGYGITVDHYKDRWHAALKREWNGSGLQPETCLNVPVDITDKQLKELTVETKVAEREKGTGKLLRFKWVRPSGAANELWDLLIYNTAALEMMAWDLLVNQEGRPAVSWLEWWNRCEQEKLFFVG